MSEIFIRFIRDVINIMRIVLFLICTLVSFAMKSQVTNDSLYMGMAKKMFVRELNTNNLYRNSNTRNREKTLLLEDTVNIRCIFPMYYIPMSYKDSITECSILQDMIDFSHNPKNFSFIVVKGRLVWTGYYEIGYCEEVLRVNPDMPYKDSFMSFCGEILPFFNLNGIVNHKQLFKIMEDHKDWFMFELIDFRGLWALDKEDNLLHIYQEGKHVKIEDGQKYFEDLISKIGVEAMRKRVDMRFD